MSFFNIPFLFYFLPVVVGGYYLLGSFKNGFVQNLFLLICSLAFLLWLEPLLFPLLVLLVPLNWFFGRKIKNDLWNGKPCKSCLVVAYAVNGGLFVVFQVMGTLASYGLPVLGLENNLLKSIVLPAGIAVFTLRSIGYVADVYTERTAAEDSLLNLGLYLCFFPRSLWGHYRGIRTSVPSLATLSAPICFITACAVWRWGWVKKSFWRVILPWWQTPSSPSAPPATA